MADEPAIYLLTLDESGRYAPEPRNAEARARGGEPPFAPGEA